MDHPGTALMMQAPRDSLGLAQIKIWRPSDKISPIEDTWTAKKETSKEHQNEQFWEVLKNQY